MHSRILRSDLETVSHKSGVLVQGGCLLQCMDVVREQGGLHG